MDKFIAAQVSCHASLRYDDSFVLLCSAPLVFLHIFFRASEDEVLQSNDQQVLGFAYIIGTYMIIYNFQFNNKPVETVASDTSPLVPAGAHIEQACSLIVD